MKVKNVSGSTLTVAVGRRTYTIANNGIQEVDESTEAYKSVSQEITKGNLQIAELPAPALFTGKPSVRGYAAIQLNTVINTDVVTVGSTTFEFEAVSPDGVTAGNTAVSIGANTQAAAANLKTAINANASLAAAGIVADDVVNVSTSRAYVIVKATGSTAIADVTVSSPDSTITITKVNAADATGLQQVAMQHTCTAAEQLVTVGLNSITDYTFWVRTAAGAIKAYDGTVIKGDGFLFFDDDGATDLAATDTIFILAFGL